MSLLYVPDEQLSGLQAIASNHSRLHVCVNPAPFGICDHIPPPEDTESPDAMNTSTLQFPDKTPAQ